MTVESRDFGILLKHYRQAAQLTQEELAERAHLSPRAISDLERGARRAPRRDTVALLAHALGLGPAERLALEGAVLRRRGPPLGPGALPSVPDAKGSGSATLPLPPTPLVGRAEDLTAITRLVHHGRRLLTLTGPGGVGKTRLALAVASEVAATFPSGVLFIALAEISAPALLPTLARALDLRPEHAPDLMRLLVEHLRDKRLLLLLDNFEHLLEAAPVLADLVARCPQVTLLVTSQATLRLRAEHEYMVQPLAVPAPGADIATLERCPSVELFVQRACDLRPDFVLDAANADAIATICVRLDGLPLAIELAAARIKLLPPAALLAQLASCLPLLTGGARDLPARQQTLRQTLAWSYDLLHAGEQALFRRLAVCVGGCTLPAIAAIAGAESQLPERDSARGSTPTSDALPLAPSLLDWLGSLVEKSFVRQEPQGDDTLRFTMLETLREYGLEQLEACGEAERTRRRHMAYYLALAEEAEPHVLGMDQRLWLTRLEHEAANLRAALGWARAHGMCEEGLRLAGALRWFWTMHGPAREEQGWLEDLLSQVAGAPEHVMPAVRAKALLTAATLAWGQADHARAAACSAQSLQLYRALGEPEGMATALHTLQAVALAQADYAQAVALGEECLALRRAVGDRRGVARILNNLGLVAIYRGEHERAARVLEECLALSQEVGDRYSGAIALTNLGLLALEQGAPERAVRVLEECVALSWELGDHQTRAIALMHLGQAAHDQHVPERAVALYAESLAVFRNLGGKRMAAMCLERWASTSCAQGRAVQAVRFCAAAAALRVAIGAPLPPNERAAQERTLAIAHTILGDAFGEVWHAGGALTFDQVVREALESAEGTTVRPEPDAARTRPG